jgi:hypothetical protein
MEYEGAKSMFDAVMTGGSIFLGYDPLRKNGAQPSHQLLGGKPHKQNSSKSKVTGTWIRSKYKPGDWSL